MWSTFKRIFIRALIGFFIAVIIAFCTLQSSRLWESALTRALKKQGYQVHTCDIGQVSFKFYPQALVASVHLDVTKDGHRLDLVFDGLRFRFSESWNETEIFFKKGTFTVDGALMKVEDVIARFKKEVMAIKQLEVGKVMLDGYEWTAMEGDINYSDERIHIHLVRGKFGDGMFQGDIFLFPKNNLAYQLKLIFTKVNLVPLAKFNNSMFHDVNGIMSGPLEVEGDLNELKVMKSSFVSSKGGTLYAEFFGKLVKDLPITEKDRQIINDMIKAQEQVHFGKFAMDVYLLDPHKFLITFDLTTLPPLTFNPNVTAEVTFGGNLVGPLADVKTVTVRPPTASQLMPYGKPE